MKKALTAYSLFCVLLLLSVGCQDDAVAPFQAPALKTRGLPQSNKLSLAITVAADQTEGTIHYAVFKESEREGKPTVQELMESLYRDELPMQGSEERIFTVAASSQTKYVVYAMLQLGDQFSEVTELQVETI